MAWVFWAWPNFRPLVSEGEWQRHRVVGEECATELRPAWQYRRRHRFNQYWVEQVGDDGVVMLNLTESPLKRLHWLVGPQNATMFIVDHPAEMRALAKIHEEKILTMLVNVVDNPDVDLFIATDNLDAMFYPPYFYKDYCHDFFARAAEIIHSRHKHLVVHACGRSNVLLPLVGESKVDCLAGVTPPPMGDVELG